MNTVLFGIKGCGKTTLGKLLAKKKGCAFIDTDYLVQEIYQLNRHKKLSCHDIYKELGPVAFRALEYEVVQSLQDVQNSVIAMGGGSMLLHENVDALRKRSHLIYLFFEREKLKRRVLSIDPLPAFINPNDPESSFDKMYDERDDFYQKLSTHKIDITSMKDEEIIHTICEITKNGKQ